ncbi:MAG: NAD(P)-dependent oxidoreductase [Pseudomonadota bacterium]
MTDTEALHIHFETRRGKPPVFRMTAPAIAAAAARNPQAAVRTSLGEDLVALDWLDSAAGLVTSNDVLRDPRFPLDRLAEAAPRLRWVHVIGAGIEPLLPLDWLGAVTLTNNSGVHVEKTRESVMMALLMLNARVPAIAANQRQARWDQLFTPAIAGKTVLIVGVGEMGGAAAGAAKTLGLAVIGVRRGGAPHPGVDRMVATDALDTVLPSADFIVIATPLTPATRNLIDRRRIGLMKRGAGLLNIGRAGCLDHVALVEALDTGALSGAIVDVYDPEPLPGGSPLWRAPNLILMPHVTSDDADRYMPMTLDLVFANAARLARGEPLRNAVDPTAGY